MAVAQWVGQDILHVYTYTLSYPDHLAEEVSVCLQNHILPFHSECILLIVDNVFSLCFIILSWNFTDGGSLSNLVYVSDTTLLPLLMLLEDP